MKNHDSRIKALGAWHFKPSFFYGWLILGFALLAGFAATGSSQLVFGAMQTFLLDDFGWQRSTLSIPITLATWTSGIVAPLVGRLADRYGARWLMPIGAVVVALGFFGIAGVQAVWHFYCAYLVARVLSGSFLAGLTASTTIVNWFQTRRNMALGILSMAHPFGGALNIIFLQFLSIRYGWRRTYQLFGGFTLFLSIPLILIMRRKPEDIGLLPNGMTDRLGEGSNPGDTTESSSDPTTSGNNSAADWTFHDAVRTSSLWLVGLALALGTLTIGSINFHLVPYLALAGVSRNLAVGALSLSSLLGGMGNIGWGALADRFSARKCAIVAFIFASGMVIFLLMTRGPASAYTFALFWGFATRGQAVLCHMIIAQYFGRTSFGALAGIIHPLQSMALGLGPTLAAVFFDWTGSYRGLYTGFFFSELVAATMLFFAKPPEHQSPKSQIGSSNPKN